LTTTISPTAFLLCLGQSRGGESQSGLEWFFTLHAVAKHFMSFHSSEHKR
jgi:hypothetical protein